MRFGADYPHTHKSDINLSFKSPVIDPGKFLASYNYTTTTSVQNGGH